MVQVESAESICRKRLINGKPLQLDAVGQLYRDWIDCNNGFSGLNPSL
jgi:hypothetical protein